MSSHTAYNCSGHTQVYMSVLDNIIWQLSFKWMAYHENPLDFVKYDVYTIVSHATSQKLCITYEM